MDYRPGLEMDSGSNNECRVHAVIGQASGITECSGTRSGEGVPRGLDLGDFS